MSEIKPFRWEAEALADDPFAGDFGNGEVALSDKMVTTRGGGTCHTCAGKCEPGTRNRVLTERGDEGLETFRWCQSCCFAMAVYDRRPSLGDARFALGEERRRLARRLARCTIGSCNRHHECQYTPCRSPSPEIERLGGVGV